MQPVKYETKFGSLAHYEKGGVQIIDDDVRHYAFSNCFEIASKAQPYEKVVFGQNQIYVLETMRAEGTSPWYTCAHDEFALVMDGEVEASVAPWTDLAVIEVTPAGLQVREMVAGLDFATLQARTGAPLRPPREGGALH
jgi:hypothetical protein